MAKPGDTKKWLEVTLAIAALVVSAVSLWVAIGTEDANRKMVSAASWPLIQFITSDADENSHTEIIKLSVSNSGVGPAKIESFELFWKGRPMRGASDLLTHCCGYVRPPNPADRPLTSTVPQTIMRAGETRPFAILAKTGANSAVYERFNDARISDLRYRACYCSVFDECWVIQDNSINPTPVKACVAPPVQYND
jgi:hypothetical protein